MPKGGKMYGSGKGSGKGNRGNGGSKYPTAGNSKEKYGSYAPPKYDNPKT